MLASERKKARLKRARRILRERGWSIRRAALYLDRNYVHLHQVLHGGRESTSLINRVLEIPHSPIPYRDSGFAKHS